MPARNCHDGGTGEARRADGKVTITGETGDKGNHGHRDSANDDGKGDLTLSEILNMVFCLENSIKDEQEE